MRLGRYARAAIDLSRRARRVWRPAGTAGASDHRRRVSAGTARIHTGHIWYRCCDRTGDRPGIGGYLSEAYNWRMVFLLILRSVPRPSSLYGYGCTTRTNVINKLELDGFLALSIAVTCGN